MRGAPDLATENAASRLPAELVELMAAAAYEASRPIGCSRPPWPETIEEWRTSERREMAAALVAAERAGFRITKG